jgi:hypothetical protein
MPGDLANNPLAFPRRPSRALPQGIPEALPYPILRHLSNAVKVALRRAMSCCRPLGRTETLRIIAFMRREDLSDTPRLARGVKRHVQYNAIGIAALCADR